MKTFEKLAIFLGYVMYSGISRTYAFAMDLIYGPAQVVGAPAPAKNQNRRARDRGDFKPTIAIERPPVLAVPAAPAVSPSTDPLVLQPARPLGSPAAPSVSDRVAVAEICGPRGLVFGVMWLYLYPAQQFAKRVVKITDRKLARSLGWERYYFPQVPYDPAKGTADLLAELHKEVSRLLNQGRTTMREKRGATPEAATAAPAPAPAPTSAPKPAPTQVEAPKAPTTAAPKPGRPEKAFHRQVEGDAFEGVVVSAGNTERTDGSGRAYQSFCLTLHDKGKEYPLMGAELRRLCADQQIQQGERVRVVYMGKAPVDVPGQGRSYKNLYNLTRVTT